MIKTELLKLIESLGDKDDVLETLKENEDIKGFAKSLNTINDISAEDFKELLANNKEIKGYYTSTMDSAISKAVNSHDEKFMKEKFPQLLNEELKKVNNKDKTPEQIKLEELQSQIEQMQKEKVHAENIAKYSKILGEKKLPIELVDFILSDNEDNINSNIDFFNNLITNSVNNGIKERLGNKDETPPKDEQLNEEELLNKQLEQAMGIK